VNDRETESWQTRLTAMGCDVEGAIRRLGNDRDFYTHLFTTFIREKSWEDLASAMEMGNYEHAFESAHKLKGSTVTLGLTPLTDLIILLMNELRLIRDKKGEASEKKARLYCRDLVEMANCFFAE
jgi:HPt (histidine-containing phosphotransfer) domain-containing protein